MSASLKEGRATFGFDPEGEQDVDFGRYLRLLGAHWWVVAAGVGAGRRAGWPALRWLSYRAARTARSPRIGLRSRATNAGLRWPVRGTQATPRRVSNDSPRPYSGSVSRPIE